MPVPVFKIQNDDAIQLGSVPKGHKFELNDEGTEYADKEFLILKKAEFDKIMAIPGLKEKLDEASANTNPDNSERQCILKQPSCSSTGRHLPTPLRRRRSAEWLRPKEPKTQPLLRDSDEEYKDAQICALKKQLKKANMNAKEEREEKEVLLEKYGKKKDALRESKRDKKTKDEQIASLTKQLGKTGRREDRLREKRDKEREEKEAAIEQVAELEKRIELLENGKSEEAAGRATQDSVTSALAYCDNKAKLELYKCESEKQNLARKNEVLVSAARKHHRFVNQLGKVFNALPLKIQKEIKTTSIRVSGNAGEDASAGAPGILAIEN